MIFIIDFNVLTIRRDYEGKAKMSEFFDNTTIINYQPKKCILAIQTHLL